MIVDSFLFFQELDLLEIRLRYLYPFVDKFIIVESCQSFTGRRKEFNFEKNIKRYDKYLKKIIYFKITDFHKSVFDFYKYLAKKNKRKKFAMLIYNKKLAVCPLTTHVPLKKVNKLVTKKNIKEKVELINNFYKKFRGFQPKIAVLGLNPHCESTDKFNEDTKIVSPIINNLKNNGYNI